MSLQVLFHDLADALDSGSEIETLGATALREAEVGAVGLPDGRELPDVFRTVMTAATALPVCRRILDMPFDWVPPQTSSDPLYIAHSHSKVHVELLGPQGLIASDRVRLGLYGIAPDAEYGLRTHPAEEVFVMLAGEADWKRGASSEYTPHGPGERSFHPSMLPHATRTRHSAFMSAYIWRGDLSTENYVYHG